MRVGPRAHGQLRPSVFACIALGAIFLAACGSGRSAERDALIPKDPGNLKGTQWILVETGDSDAVPVSTPFTLTIGEGTASGSGPCNRYHLAFSHDGDDLTTGTVASTQMACAPRLGSAEHRYFRRLEAADTVDLEQERLVLSGPDDVRLVFERADDAAGGLAGKWDIVNYATASAIQSPVKGTKPTLDFGSDGTLAIATGCNAGNATWTAHGQSVTIDAPRSTLKACADPPGVMEQEAHIFAALPLSKTVELTHSSAALLDSKGNTLFVLARDT